MKTAIDESVASWLKGEDEVEEGDDDDDCDHNDVTTSVLFCCTYLYLFAPMDKEE